MVNKELVYKNIYNLINNGFFVKKYIEATTKDVTSSDDFYISDIFGESYDKETKTNNYDIEKENENNKYLEDVAAGIFNAIIIGCQLFDDEERIKKFVNYFSWGITPYALEECLSEFGISKQEALHRLNHGFVVHFTTSKISEEIQKSGKLVCAGKNAMFSEEENKIIDYAASVQKKNNPMAEEKLNFLFRGWGTGVSSYGSITNGFWMYHTPESLTFLFGDISKRNKADAMKFVTERILSLKDEDRKIVFKTMSNIYDRLIGEEQNACCILIDRDAFEYERDYYYATGTPVSIERRPYNENFNSLMSSDSIIKTDIDVSNLKFLTIPTISELERLKTEQLRINASIFKETF